VLHTGQREATAALLERTGEPSRTRDSVLGALEQLALAGTALPRLQERTDVRRARWLVALTPLGKGREGCVLSVSELAR
jgi:hypothetical protein